MPREALDELQLQVERRAQTQMSPATRRKKIEHLFAAGREEHFEDGMESNFSRALVALVEEQPDEVLETVRQLIGREGVNAEVATEALRWLGVMDDPRTADSRLALFKEALTHVNPCVRDAAGVALACVDDPAVIPAVTAALENEKVPWVHKNLRQVLEQLEETRDAVAAEKGSDEPVVG